jgi:hypothetical protein
VVKLLGGSAKLRDLDDMARPLRACLRRVTHSRLTTATPSPAPMANRTSAVDESSGKSAGAKLAGDRRVLELVEAWPAGDEVENALDDPP